MRAMLSPEIRAWRESPEPLAITSSGKSSPRLASQSAMTTSPAPTEAGLPNFSAARVSTSVRAMTLLENLLTTRTTSASVCDSCINNSRLCCGVGPRRMPPATLPPCCSHSLRNVP